MTAPVASTPATMVTAERVGDAMGSTLHVVAIAAEPVAADSILDRTVALVEELERRWSRFLPTSEISRLNASPSGQALPVTTPTLHLVERGIEAWRRTNGWFDPTVLRALIDAGYDRPFDQLHQFTGDETPPSGSSSVVAALMPGLPGPAEGCRRIVVDGAVGTIGLPADVGFDPGGLGKGLAADLAAGAAMEQGALGIMVNLGGDLRCMGVGPGGGAWAIGLPSAVGAGEEHAAVKATANGSPPLRPGAERADYPIVDISGGAVATSTCRRRRWSTRAGDAHHLIDPSTGRPAERAPASVTVIAGNACDAETLATAIAARGTIPDSAVLGAASVLLVDDRGRRSTAGPVERFLR